VPGGIEPHAHLAHFISMRTESEMYTLGPEEDTVGMAFGGVTTHIDFCQIYPGTTAEQAGGLSRGRLQPMGGLGDQWLADDYHLAGACDCPQRSAPWTAGLRQLRAAQDRFICRSATNLLTLQSRRGPGTTRSVDMSSSVYTHLGLEPARMDRLPDTSALPNEIIVGREQRNGYDHALRAAGSQPASLHRRRRRPGHL
jgi:hypothetical protein